MKSNFKIKQIILFVSILPIFLLAFDGKVIKVIDGDTITILTQNKEQIRVRLYGIDAPEKKQAYGDVSKKALSNMIAGKQVEIKEHGRDIYKRVLGAIFLNNVDINAKMVSNGYAWAFIKYSKKYVEQEQFARKNKKGLWQDKNAIAPWEFRKLKR